MRRRLVLRRLLLRRLLRRLLLRRLLLRRLLLRRRLLLLLLLLRLSTRPPNEQAKGGPLNQEFVTSAQGGAGDNGDRTGAAARGSGRARGRPATAAVGRRSCARARACPRASQRARETRSAR